MPELTPQDVLLKAIDVIHECGLTKGQATDNRSGAVCAFGALNIAVVGNARFSEHTQRDSRVRQVAVDVIEQLPEFARSFRARFGRDPVRFAHSMKSPLAEWNDHPDTTADDVVHMFKYAAEL